MSGYISGSYNKCLFCDHLGKGCDGPNVLSMTLERWCEWCHDLKRLRGFTNAEISEISGVSVKTVDRVMNGTINKDIMLSTASEVTKALVGSAGQWPCAMLAEDSPLHNAEINALREDYQSKIKHLKEEIEHLKEEIEHLKEESAQKDKIINKLMGIGT